MTCQDNCLYYPICRDSGFLMYHTRIKKTLTLTENVEKECPFKMFKNKADFVEVVRCKDCTFRQPIDESRYTFKGKPAMVCILHSKAVAEDGYCSYGERRDT